MNKLLMLAIFESILIEIFILYAAFAGDELGMMSLAFLLFLPILVALIQAGERN